MDSFLGRYRIRIKSRKWYLRLFYHMIDLSIINSWILYKKVNERSGNTKIMNLGEFRAELAESLCKYKAGNGNKRGRPSQSSLERELDAKAKRGKMTYMPPKNVRTDGIAHHEKRCEKKNRCKLPNCKGFTRIVHEMQRSSVSH